MFGLKLPVLAAAGVLGVVALGGVTGLPERAFADDGGGVPSTASSSWPSAPASAPADTDPDTGPDPDAPGGDGMDVSPATVAPGGVVNLHLKASCTSGAKAQASAEVFVDAVTLSPAGDGWDGTAFIKSDAADGSYTVSVRCDGSTSSASATVTVSSGGTGGGGGRSPVMPVNPVPAGGGGAAQLAAGPVAAGAGTVPLLVTGAVAAAGLAGLALHRRRAAARG